MHGLHAADIAVIALYLAGIAVIGIRSGRGLKLSADFFMPRRFGKLMMVMFSFGAGTHSDQPVGVASKIYTSGWSGILVSLLTRPVPDEKLENFYALLRTPVKPGEQVAVPCTLPAHAVVPERHNLFPNSRFEIPVPSRTGIVGFLVGWACAGGLTVVLYAITRM